MADFGLVGSHCVRHASGQLEDRALKSTEPGMDVVVPLVTVTRMLSNLELECYAYQGHYSGIVPHTASCVARGFQGCLAIAGCCSWPSSIDSTRPEFW
eukprot:3684312-Rhodomonas_salina.1